MATVVLPVTGDPEADELLVTDPFALLVGMLLDQQVPMEWAFRGPATLRERLGTHIVENYDGDAAAIWRGVSDPKVLFDRLRELPGFGEEKAKIFLAVLG